MKNRYLLNLGMAGTSISNLLERIKVEEDLTVRNGEEIKTLCFRVEKS